MSKSDYRHRRDSIESHMSAVVTAMAPQHLAEVAAALSIIGYAAHLWGTATDRFRRRAHQPDLHCCRRRRRHCCGSAGQRSKGA